MREMALSDWTTGINTAMEKGKTECRAEGMEKSKMDIARNLWHMGLSKEHIQEATGLDLETIQSLAKQVTGNK